jgi:hypothetical protein
MGWQSDDEKALGKDTAIASLTLGEREIRQGQTEHPCAEALAGLWLQRVVKILRLYLPFGDANAKRFALTARC